MDEQIETFDKLYAKFDADTADTLRAGKESHRLMESGQPRVSLRAIATGFVKSGDLRLNPEFQVKLCMYMASDFFSYNEYDLALEFYEMALARCDSITTEKVSVKNSVQALQNIVRSNYGAIMQLKSSYIAPMMVSKLLLCLQQLRISLERIFEMPITVQEELAWQVLNSCKLIVEIAQPLVWSSCSRYVTETMLFAAVCMESVINLCTVRHMKFRMKIYAGVFYATLAYGVTDEAAALLEHATKQVQELQEREELDPPVPPQSALCIANCLRDIAVMRFVLDCWRDPESFSLTATDMNKYYTPPEAAAALSEEASHGSHDVVSLRSPVHSFAELCASEFIRIHFLTSGNTNETFRRRTSCILKGLAHVLEQYVPPPPEATSHTQDQDHAGAAVPSNEEKTSAEEEVEAAAAEHTVSEESAKMIREFSLRCLFEFGTLVGFFPTDGVDVEALVLKLRGLHMESIIYGEQQGYMFDEESSEGLKLVLTLFDLQHVTGSLSHTAKCPPSHEKAAVLLSLLSDVVSYVESTLYSETSAFRRRAFLKRVSVELFRNYLYPNLQRVLSTLETDDAANGLSALAAPLLQISKTLDVVNAEDPLLMGTVALLTGQVLWHLGDHRGSISLLGQAIYTLDEQRGLRVDALQHMPEDVRDISALQRASISTRSDHCDWFHSVKRLGAHAFAGYGIFGLASSADRADQAMAEVQAELVSLYFRFELEYCIQQNVIKTAVRQLMAKEQKARDAEVAAAATVGKKSATRTLSQTGAGGDLAKTAGLAKSTPLDKSVTLQQAATMINVSEPIDAEALPIVTSLRSFAVRSAYYRCILLLELARVDGSAERRVDFLKEAFYAVEECEGREQMLKESFAELLVMTESTRRPPLVVARSHRYIYVAPVGTRKLKKASYYRIMAKEKGSGTDVSLHNDDIAGCERQVALKDLTNLRNSVVRIGPLRAGEQYMLGTAAFNQENRAIGGISPSTPVVDAVNPLPTLLLWSWLNQQAESVDATGLHKESSLRVFNRYFMPTPERAAVTVGRGINLFCFDQPALCMLALQQSSPLLLECFIDSCASYERLTLATKVDPAVLGAGHWVQRRPTQLAAMKSLHRAALVCTVAASIESHDLLLRCVKVGYDVAMELMRFDMVHLSQYLQGPVSVLVLSMQRILKRNWCELEHKFYSKLLGNLAKLAVLNRNLAPVLLILNSFYPEALEEAHAADTAEAEEEAAPPQASALPSEDLGEDYQALLNVVLECIDVSHVSGFVEQMRALFPSPSAEEHAAAREAVLAEPTDGPDSKPITAKKLDPEVGYIWTLSSLQRQFLLMGKAADALASPDDKAAPERIQLEQWLVKDQPQSMSQLLSVIVYFCKQLSLQSPSTAAAADASMENQPHMSQYLDRFVLCREYMCTRAQELDQVWELQVLHPIEEVAKQRAAAANAAPAAGKKGAKAPPPDPAAEAAAAEALLKVPDRYMQYAAAEESAQLRFFGEALYLMSLDCMTSAGTATNHFPKSDKGPLMYLDPAMEPLHFEGVTLGGAIADSAAEVEGATPHDAAEGSPRALTPAHPFRKTPMSSTDFIRCVGAAVDFLREGGAAYAAVHVACTLWNHIISEWLDPAQFAQQCYGIRVHILRALSAVTALMEYMSFAGGNGLDADGEMAEGANGHALAAGGGNGDGLAATRGVRFSVEVDGKNVDVVTAGRATAPAGGTAMTVQDSNFLGAPLEATHSYIRQVKENMLILRNLAVFLLKTVWLYREYPLEVVLLGSRLYKSYELNCPEFCKLYGDACLPIIMQAQETLVSNAEQLVSQRKSELDGFVFQYEEAQRKKRKKKMRIARAEKDDEELLFEAERSVYEERVQQAEQELHECQMQMEGTKLQQLGFLELYSHGSLLLDKARALVREFLLGLQTEFSNRDKQNSVAGSQMQLDFSSLLRSENETVAEQVQQRLQTLLKHLGHVVSQLRDSKERVLLIEALKMQGDLLLLFGCIAEARQAWFDIVDGIFNVMDACDDWKRIASEAVESIDHAYIPGMLPTVVALGKLSRYSAAADWDAKSRYARMAAELSRIPFHESYGHPQTVAGFAAYECAELTGVLALDVSPDALSTKDLSVALHEIIAVLLAEQYYVAALPCIVLLEHLYAVYSCSPSDWLDARLFRLRALTGAHMLAEAASMLANIKPTIIAIRNKSYGDTLRNKFSQRNAQLADFETSVNGLEFHGLVPFYNNLPPDNEEKNLLALKWIEEFSTDFEGFAKDFVVQLPEPELTPEEAEAQAALAAKKAEEEAAAAAANKKGKGKGGAKGGKGTGSDADAATTEKHPMTVPLFTAEQVAGVHAATSQFLLVIAELDTATTRPHSAPLQRTADQGISGLKRATEVLFAAVEEEQRQSTAAAAPHVHDGEGPFDTVPSVEPTRKSPVLRASRWLDVYGRVKLARLRQMIHRRQYQPARAALNEFLRFLANDELCSISMDGDARGVLCQLWFKAQSLLILVAERQSRFDAVVALSTQASAQAAMQLSGFWLRDFLFSRARAHFKLGNLHAALTDCEACLDNFSTNKVDSGQLHIRCLLLKASTSKELAAYSSPSQAALAYLSVLDSAREATKMAAAAAAYAGAFAADTNATFARSATSLLKHHLEAPVLHNLTELHENEPMLSLGPQFHAKRLGQHMIHIPSVHSVTCDDTSSQVNTDENIQHTGIAASEALSPLRDAASVSGPLCGADKVPNLRLGPADASEEIYSESEFVNIYLAENRQLLLCQVALCQVLEDARCAGLEESTSFAKHYAEGELLREQLSTGESSLKLLRHCVYIPIAVRISVLALAGKARIATKSDFSGARDDFAQSLLGPLQAALQVAINGGGRGTHLWRQLRDVCLQFVETYGDHAVDLGEDMAPHRLKFAVVYLLAAIRTSNQFALLTKDTIALSNDAAFDAASNAELAHIVSNVASSSATPDKIEAADKAAMEQTAAANAKGAKGNKGGAASNVGVLEHPTGRDALFLLCALLRERDPLWHDAAENDLCQDMHALLQQCYPATAYADKCRLAQVPDPAGDITVPKSSVSTLWNAVKMPPAFASFLDESSQPPNDLDYSAMGLYSHVAVFFLLGDAQPLGVAPAPAAGAAAAKGKGAEANTGAGSLNSVNPILTKLVLPRVDVEFLEKSIRDVRDRLLDANDKLQKTLATPEETAVKLAACGNDFGKLLTVLVRFLKDGVIKGKIVKSILKRKASVGVSAGGKSSATEAVCEYELAADNSSVVLSIPVGSAGQQQQLTVAVSDTLMFNLANTFCPDLDTESVVDNELSVLLRTALGY